ncbi:hypothetical protein EHW99_1571 [Erwinia amylovora]|nr:hypothetical protein EHX00_1571 [Erwinia amylovora]QJQ57973.1 hypothetical protein EHW99_1571 [Erwinia amylovora]QJQ61672.1 hypothetical protein EHW98_1571 [Erwinia amylovora]QJQ65474.1 hypothetical protein EHW96_1571 [Erwinia amylovora]QJQ69173.1 hypothetical protein EGZ89_1571 [Erwinia amylovora]
MMYRQQIDITLFGLVKLMLVLTAPGSMIKRQRLLAKGTLVGHNTTPSTKDAAVYCKSTLKSRSPAGG